MEPSRSSSTKTVSGIILILAGLCLWAKAEEGCPPPEDIEPCVCYNSPYTVLRCTSIRNEDVLRDVFLNSKRYSYREVHIQFAILKHLPKEMFEGIEVSELYLTNSTFNAVFDSPPENLKSLEKIYLENTRIIEITQWELFKPLTHLKILTIYYNHIHSIGPEFSEYVPKDLSQLTFYATETKEIKPGTFAEFTKLDKVAIDACKLKEISRDIFSRPSSIKHIYFNDNDIKIIPDDMFVDMPYLHTVGLKDNLITTVPESAFGGNIARISWLLLNGNPLKCNCDLKWLLNNKPDFIGGTCASPIRLHDKLLKDLTEKDFKC